MSETNHVTGDYMTTQSELMQDVENVLEGLGLPFTNSDGIFDVVEPTLAFETSNNEG